MGDIFQATLNRRPDTLELGVLPGSQEGGRPVPLQIRHQGFGRSLE